MKYIRQYFNHISKTFLIIKLILNYRKIYTEVLLKYAKKLVLLDAFNIDFKKYIVHFLLIVINRHLYKNTTCGLHII